MFRTRQASAGGGTHAQALQGDEFEFAYPVAAPIDMGPQFSTNDFEAAAGIVIAAFSKIRQPLKPIADHAGFSAARDSLTKT